MASGTQALLAAGMSKASGPWPRSEVDAPTWRSAIECLVAEESALVGLWGDADQVHMAVLDRNGASGILTLPCANGGFPSVGASHPSAIRLERAIKDLFGHEAIGAPDARPWLDHGRW